MVIKLMNWLQTNKWSKISLLLFGLNLVNTLLCVLIDLIIVMVPMRGVGDNLHLVLIVSTYFCGNFILFSLASIIIGCLFIRENIYALIWILIQGFVLYLFFVSIFPAYVI